MMLMFPLCLPRLRWNSHSGIPTNNVPPLLSRSSQICHAMPVGIQCIFCSAAKSLSAPLTFSCPFVGGTAQPHVIYWAWLQDEQHFTASPSLTAYNPETGLNSSLSSCRNVSCTASTFCHFMLSLVDKLLCVQLWNIKPVRCMWGCCLWYASITSSPTVSLLTEAKAANASFSSHFFGNERRCERGTREMRRNYNKVATQDAGTWRWWNRGPL